MADGQSAHPGIARPDRGLRGAVIANVVLLALLAAVSLGPRAAAQRGARAHGEYSMVSGKVMGGNSSVVYIVDGANQEMIAVRWNDGARTLQGIGYRSIDADGVADPGR